tara:strand:- start:390 stop:689 length:300 start_codon:yes stop_codon:yes gene_type:complete
MIEIDEVIIDGERYKIEYDDEYADGWRLNRLRIVPSATYLKMKAKKNSPFEKDREAYKEWKRLKQQESKNHRAMVHALLQSVSNINDHDIILKSDDSEE